MNEIELRYWARVSANLLMVYNETVDAFNQYEVEDRREEMSYVDEQMGEVRLRVNELGGLEVVRRFYHLRGHYYNKLMGYSPYAYGSMQGGD